MRRLPVKSLYSRADENAAQEDKPATWRRAEEAIRELYDLTEAHGPYYDARDEDGAPVEIKSCAAQYADDRVGRFEVWSKQLDELFPEGRVALLVYRPSEPYYIIAHHMTRPAALFGKGTSTGGRHPTMGLEVRERIPWPDVVPMRGINFAFRRGFIEHYDDDEYIEELLPLEKPDDSDAESTQ